MKERPILMTTESVKAILDGRKTQTRRVIKPQPELTIADGLYRANIQKLLEGGDKVCPYGQVGDRLWVRETAWYGPQEKRVEFIPNSNKGAQENATFYGAKKKPSIFMPRWASRLTLEITGVRVERLQEISAFGCGEEGVQRTGDIIVVGKDMKKRFQLLWDSINGKKYPWSSNPWCWVIKFDNIGVRVK